MKSIYSLLVIALLVLAVIPGVIGEGIEIDSGIEIEIEPPVNECPEIFTDVTSRSWYPNDQTIYTATEYGTCDINCYGDEYCEVDKRGNYVFTGELVMYYLAVYDPDGAEDIKYVRIEKDGSGVGACLELDPDDLPGQWLEEGDMLPSELGNVAWDSRTMKLYKCQLIVQNGWFDLGEIRIVAEDESEQCSGESKSVWSDFLLFNPVLSVDLIGTIDFGNVTAGSTATSNSVQIQNNGGDGVVMDMYIASDDYFTDPGNEDAICGEGNGIKYDKFSYYATKGSVNSGKNDNSESGLGDDTGICISDPDEFTKMPSHSGHIEDMCRIINHKEAGSFLAQGQEMSITFQLDVPSNCVGSFTDGKFHFVGRVV